MYICKVTAQRRGTSTLSLRTRSVAKSIQQSKLPYVRPLRAQHEGRVSGGPSPQSARPDRAETRSADWTYSVGGALHNTFILFVAKQFGSADYFLYQRV